MKVIVTGTTGMVGEGVLLVARAGTAACKDPVSCHARI
jgi:hypothetical protein